MISDISSTTSQIVHLALDASALAHKIHANNIANSNTPGFIPSRLNFEEQLQLGLNPLISDNSSNKSMMLDELARLSDDLNSGNFVTTENQDSVQIDIEMIELTKNVLRYQALLEGLSKFGSITRMAVSESRE